MSTRSNIARLNSDGSVDVIYCHWDGYLTGVGMTLVLHYDTKKEMNDLIDLGDISSLRDTIEETKKETYKDKVSAPQHFESLDAYAKHLQETQSWVEYVYVAKEIEEPERWMPDVEWFVAHNHNDGKLQFTKVPNPFVVLATLDKNMKDAPLAIL